MNKILGIQRVLIDNGGVLLSTDPTDEREQEGIFNPTVAGGHLLYRAAGPGNYSRILAAKLTYDQRRGDLNAERLSETVLEPEQPYERVSKTSGGIEDPRISRLPGEKYVMFYTAFGFQPAAGQQAPAIAVATSSNGLDWNRLGPVLFAPLVWNGQTLDLNKIPNKDAVLFSEKVNGRYAMYHRPMWSTEEAEALDVPPRGIWYAEADTLTGPWQNHAFVAGPAEPWEANGIGAGVPPIKLGDFWLNIYHGFLYDGRHKHYSAGAFMTPSNRPQEVSWRQTEPALEPIVFDENVRVETHIAFPTAAWRTPSGQILIIWGREDRLIMWGYLDLELASSGLISTLQLPA